MMQTKRRKSTSMIMIEKTIPLVLNPGKDKKKYLNTSQAKIVAFANQLLPFTDQAKSLNNFHHLVYRKHKYLGIQSQVQEAVQRRVYASKKAKLFRNLPLEFNFPRSGNLKFTAQGHPILSLSPLKQRIAFPVEMNGGWYRLQDHVKGGWEAHSCIVFKKNRQWVAHLVIRRPLPPVQEVEGTIGVDIGIKVAAAYTLNHPCFPLVEQYLGKDLAWKQHQFLRRRAMLQKHASHGSISARRALKRLRYREKKYVQTRCAQIAHEIVDLAVLTRSAIVVEDVTHLRKKWTKQATKGKKGAKKTRRQLNKWPYRVLLYKLIHLAQLQSVPVLPVQPHFTSQTCSHCGKRSKHSRTTRDLYRCHFCGFEVHADRNASRNISLLGKYKQGLKLFSSWKSYLPVPHERLTSCYPVSMAEMHSTISHGTMSGSVHVD